MTLTYADLAAMANTQDRGYAFETYVADLLRRENFAVVHRPGAANRREVDLFAHRGNEHYLLEVKWRKGPLGVPGVDDLRRRLERGAPNIVDVLVSANGFSRTAAARVEEDMTRPVLSVSGPELAEVERTGTLHRLLASKHEQLIVHRRASIAGAQWLLPEAGRVGLEPLGGYAFADSEGNRRSVEEVAGDFGPVAFCLELPDLDWADGHAVGLEVEVPGCNMARLGQVFRRLDERGWVTPAGTWRIPIDHREPTRTAE